MNGMNNAPIPETNQERIDRENREMAEAWESFIDSIPAEQMEGFLKEEKRDAGPEIEEVEGKINDFESTYSLVELHAITHLTDEEAKVHPLRAPAGEAIKPIYNKLALMKKETNISVEKYDELNTKYKKLAKAVGIRTSNNEVDHTR
jgi:hypothetical protein